MIHWIQQVRQEQIIHMDDYKYEKPTYDPFETFNPSEAFIKEVIRSLNSTAYQLLQRMASLKSNPVGSFQYTETAAEHKRILTRIQSLQFRLQSYRRTGRWDNPHAEGFIGTDQVSRAKERAIESFYEGRLRKAGKRLVGQCPFHDERTASFVIYTDQNSYHCFGCGTNGDVIDYIRKKENLEFLDAVRFLLR